MVAYLGCGMIDVEKTSATNGSCCESCGCSLDTTKTYKVHIKRDITQENFIYLCQSCINDLYVATMFSVIDE